MHSFVHQPFFEVKLGLHQNCSITMLLPMAFTFTSLPMENWRSLQLMCKLYFIWVLENYITYKHNWKSFVLEFPSSYCVRSVCWASCYVTFMWLLLLCSALIRETNTVIDVVTSMHGLWFLDGSWGFPLIWRAVKMYQTVIKFCRRNMKVAI
jgi:hypothetical protein